MALSETLDQIKSRKEFYRNLYRKSVALLFGIMILLYLLCAGIIFEALTRTSPLFYSTSNDGTVMGLRPSVPPPEGSSSQAVEQY